MTDPKDEPGFDFASPRWREGADTQHAVERDRRLWDRHPPGQHGAIDARESVPRQHDDERIGPDGMPAAPAHSAGAVDDPLGPSPSAPSGAGEQAVDDA